MELNIVAQSESIIMLSRSKNVKEALLASTGTLRILVVVDYQKTFCEGGALAVKGGNALARKINALMACGFYDFIIISQDHHGSKHKSYSINSGIPLFQLGTLNGLPQMGWPEHGNPDKIGLPSHRSDESREKFKDESAEFHDDLDLRHVNMIVRKGMDVEVDSYSAFYNNGREASEEVRKAHPHVKFGVATGLTEEIMKFAARFGITDRSKIHIDFVGLAYDYCVAWSAIDAAFDGFKARVIFDGCASIAPPEATTKTLREKCVSVVRLSTVFRQARRRKRRAA